MKYVIYLIIIKGKYTESALDLEAQREMCKKFVREQGSHEFHEFIDKGYSEAVSMQKRPSLLRAIDSLIEGDFLVIDKRNRLGSDIIVNAMIESAVIRKKAKLVLACGDVRNDDEPTSFLMKRMMGAFSEYERLIIGASSRLALQVKKSRNERVGYIPYGFGLHQDGVHLKLDDEELFNINLMKQLTIDGFSLRQIAQHMNNCKRFNRNGLWNHVSLSRVMKGK